MDKCRCQTTKTVDDGQSESVSNNALDVHQRKMDGNQKNILGLKPDQRIRFDNKTEVMS
ncbi:hypothetical protein DPMN_099852 [Dreissena polymorpha]|uniref:Uncharacterized protein n=1 Tax=Dreissena polymorpha TaxID=45954 RepID=A0A9D4LI18_DREPO|nr:hypothetical protein DPMN_099852 [Dreissena polymorpha]